MTTKEELRTKAIETDPMLGADEKETSITFPNDTEYGLFHSEVPTTIKWFLSVEESEVTDHRTVDGAIVSVTGTIPKGILKLQGNARKSDTHSQMVSYGPHK